jgi:hypothetical protein
MVAQAGLELTILLHHHTQLNFISLYFQRANFSFKYFSYYNFPTIA